MTTDPLDALAHGDHAVAPRAEFAAQLRARLLTELEITPDPAPSSTPDITPATTSTTRSTTMPDQTSTTSTTSTAATTNQPAVAPVTRSLSMYLVVRRASEALAFYQEAFGAEITMRLDQPDGRVGHAELRIGDSTFSLADEFPEMGIVGPEALGNTTVTVELTVPDVDEVFARALAAGATELRPVEAQFYGARSGRLQDPFGHRWSVSTPVETVSNEELQRRLDDLYREDG